MRFHAAQQVWSEAFAVGSGSPDVSDVKVQFGIKDNDWQIVAGIESGKVQAVITKLDPLYRAWGMCAYTSMGTREQYDRLLDELLKKYGLLYPGDFVQIGFRRNARLLELITIALEDRIFIENTGCKKFTAAEISRSIEIDPRNFSRDWGIVYERLQKIMDSWPKNALGPLWPLIHAEQDKREAELGRAG